MRPSFGSSNSSLQGFRPFTFCNFYILLYVLYTYQDLFLGSSGTIYSRLIVLLLMLLGVYHAFYVYSHYKPPKMMNALTVLIVVFSIYGAILIISGKTIRAGSARQVISNLDYLKFIYVSLLPIYSFYYFTKKGQLSENMFPLLALLILTVTIIYWSYTQQKMIYEAYLKGVNEEEFTNNLGYGFLALIPLISLLYRKPVMQYIMLALVFVMVVVCMKRGAVLIGAVVVLYFVFNNIKNASRRKKVLTIIGTFVVVFAAIIIINRMLSGSDYFNARIEQTLEGNSSGRDRLYSIFFDHFVHKVGAFQFLFGGGAFYTIVISSSAAHNDWLEIAVNQGCLGLIIYAVYFVRFFSTWHKSSFVVPQIKTTFGCLFIIIFSQTLFSMSYTEIKFYEALALGFCLACIEEKQGAKVV